MVLSPYIQGPTFIPPWFFDIAGRIYVWPWLARENSNLEASLEGLDPKEPEANHRATLQFFHVHACAHGKGEGEAVCGGQPTAPPRSDPL